MRFHIEMPSCFDEPIILDANELAPETFEVIIENLAAANPNDPRLSRLKECWDHLTA